MAATCSSTRGRPSRVPELRFDPLRREWVAYATERNDRTFLPTSFCPLCPSGAGGTSEVPLDSFEVVVFENRFPAFGPDRVHERPARPSSTATIAFVPNAARWPFEVHVYPRRHVASIADLDDGERAALAETLLTVTNAYDRHFGFSTPYVMALHQAPTDGGEWPEAHLHF